MGVEGKCDKIVMGVIFCAVEVGVIALMVAVVVLPLFGCPPCCVLGEHAINTTSKHVDERILRVYRMILFME